MRLVKIYDTHFLHDQIKSFPAGDVLIHAADFMNSGLSPVELLTFNRWLDKQPIKRRVVCGGNHDRLFQDMPQFARQCLTKAVYLENTGVTLDGVSFWGSPYTPEFLKWAFMYRRGPQADQYWDQIPEELDALITHGPPFDTNQGSQFISEAFTGRLKENGIDICMDGCGRRRDNVFVERTWKSNK